MRVKDCEADKCEYLERKVWHSYYEPSNYHPMNGKNREIYAIGDAPCRACDTMDILDDLDDYADNHSIKEMTQNDQP